MRAPDFLSTFVDDGVLMRVDVVGEGARRGGPEIREELVLGVERYDGEGELLEDRGRWGRRGNNGNRGFNDSRGKVLNWDVRKWDAVNNFLELEVDIGVLCFVGGRVLKLRA